MTVEDRLTLLENLARQHGWDVPIQPLPPAEDPPK